jgi:hypothetical protein
MTTSLQSKLTELAQAFAGSVLAAVRSVSLDELLTGTHRGVAGLGRPETHVVNGAKAPVEEIAAKRPAKARAAAAPASPTGRLPRRSADDIAAALDQVVSLVKKHREGLRAEQIRTELRMQAKEMPRVLKEGLSKKKLKAKGQKRATTYTAA